MPSKNNPKSVIKIGEGSSVCQDGSKGNLSTQVQMAQDAYDAEQISAENPFETYLGDEVQSHLDDLASQVKVKPPYLGEGAKSYSYGGNIKTISGTPDWGVLKQADNTVWDRNSTVTVGFLPLDSTYFRNTNVETLLYSYNKPTPNGSEGADPSTDLTFNYDHTKLLGGGEGASFLASAREQVNEPFRHCRVTYRGASSTASEGFTLSGFLFPADRGTVALLYWATGVPNFSYTTATSVSEISQRVISAINLGEGRLNKESSPSIFNEGTDQFVFPSKLTGQYDLREMQTGLIRNDLADAGLPVSFTDFVADPNLGSVRLLKEPGACFFGVGQPTVDPRGNIPVLFGAYSWDEKVASDWVENDTNFLAYRLPALQDYSPSGLKTPNEHRERFFQVIQPASVASDFDTAGDYVTFGDDYYTYQVARYRHVVSYEELDLTATSKGSFALVHFKKEDTFERLVRDGISPSEDDLYSVSFFNLLEGEDVANIVSDGEDYNEYGIPVLAPKNKDASSNTILRPNVFVRSRSNADKLQGSTSRTHITHKNEDADSSADLRFKVGEAYFTTISGVKYILPTRDKSKKSSDVVFLSESYNKILNKVSLVGDVHLSDFSIPRYFSSKTSASKKYNEPSSPFVLNFSAYSSDSNLFVEEPSLKEISTGKQLVTLGWDDIKADMSVYNPTVAGTYFDVNVIPQGDTGLCTFTTQGNISVMYKSPLYHYDGLGYADVLQPSYSLSNLNDGHQTSNFLYHSSRLVSLIQNANTSLFYFHFSYLAGARNADQAFAIFRYDPEGFRVYINLDLTDDRIELCSGENKIGGGGAFPSYPIYRPKINTEAPQRNAFGSEDATALLVGGETYYVEAQSGFAANLFDYSVVGTSYDVDYATDVATNFSGAYGNSAEFNNRSAGYGISAILTTESGSADIDPNIILSTRSKLHHGYDLHEVSKGVDPSLPTYGNFTQNQRGIISAMSLGTSPVISSSLVFPNDVAPLTTLFTPRKDTQERFLDESYRLSVLFDGIEDQQNLQGPGLPQGSRVNLLRVRDDVFATSVHGGAGYLRNSHHISWCVFTNDSPFYDGNGNLYNKEGEAQVSGLPSLALAPLNGGEYGVPRRGLLRLPILDYQVQTYFPNESYDPSWTTDAMAEVGLYYRQPNYTHGTGGTYYSREFSYSRAFDVEFSRSGTVENMKGTSRFQMRVLGLSFSDFAFKSDRGVSIYVKIPGLTAWLDVGRANTQGVSKQHISKDGSGCLISQREGFTVKENVYFTDLTLELGPIATFAKNSTGECPVLVKVSFKGYGMEGYDNSILLDFEPGVNPPAMSTEYYPVVLRRGLVGLEILRMSNGKNYDEDEVVYV